MAEILKIGTQAQYDSTGTYDLYDSSADHLYLISGGRSSPKQLDGQRQYIMELELAINGTSENNIKAQEKLLIMHLEDAFRYTTNKAYKTPIYLFDAADTETVRRAVVYNGKLTPVSRKGFDQSLGFQACFYLLQITRGEWESSENTTINDVTYDGVNHSSQITSQLDGDLDNRITQVVVVPTATNDETNPLTEIIMGARSKYKGMSSYDSVWEMELGTLYNETALASVADSNTYPNGSTTNNCILTTFADGVMEKRAKISLLDALAAGTSLITNGDAEDGDMTGWTPGTAFVASSTPAHINSGSYGFYETNTAGGAEVTTSESQYVDITTGHSYLVKARIKCINIDAGSSAGLIAFFTDNSLTPYFPGNIETFLTADESSSFVTVYGIGVAGTNQTKIWFKMSTTAAAGENVEIAVDDIEIFDISQDHWNGEYIPLLRSKLSEAGEVDVYLNYGYTSSDSLRKIGRTVHITHTDWKLTPMGKIKIPLSRALLDEDYAWRIGNLGFELFAEQIDTANLYVDCIILVPAKYRAHIKDISLARSSNYANDEKESTLTIETTEQGETLVYSQSSDFTGLNQSYRGNIENLYFPSQEDFLFVTFAQQDGVHDMADDFDVTVKTIPAYSFRNSET